MNTVRCKRMSAKKELPALSKSLWHINVQSAKVATRDGLKVALINEELKKTGRYQVTQYYRSDGNPRFWDMYVNGKYQGSLKNNSDANFDAIIDYLNKHKDISWFYLYKEVI